MKQVLCIAADSKEGIFMLHGPHFLNNDQVQIELERQMKLRAVRKEALRNIGVRHMAWVSQYEAMGLSLGSELHPLMRHGAFFFLYDEAQHDCLFYFSHAAEPAAQRDEQVSSLQADVLRMSGRRLSLRQ